MVEVGDEQSVAEYQEFLKSRSPEDYVVRTLEELQREHDSMRQIIWILVGQMGGQATITFKEKVEAPLLPGWHITQDPEGNITIYTEDIDDRNSS